jgi:hypothetical protein
VPLRMRFQKIDGNILQKNVIFLTFIHEIDLKYSMLNHDIKSLPLIKGGDYEMFKTKTTLPE